MANGQDGGGRGKLKACLLWLLCYRDQIEHFQRLEKVGEKTPLRDYKDLPIHLLGVYNAFSSLSKHRQCGFGVAPLSSTDIIAYLGFIGVDDFETKLDWFDLITELDITYCNHANQDNESND